MLTSLRDNRMRKLCTLLVLSGLGLGSVAYAQPPGGERERPREEPRREQPREAQRERPREEPRREQPRNPESPRAGRSHVEEWMRMLAEHMIDPHDTVRDSARAALVAIGEPAIPMLRNMANGPDDARAVAARKVIEAIERSHRRPGPAPYAGRPGPVGGPETARMSGGFGGPMGRGGPPFMSGGSAPFGRGPMTGGFSGRPMGVGPMGPMGEGEHRRDVQPPERRESGEPRPESVRPIVRPVERREGAERREEGGERRPDAPRPGERRPEAPRPSERRPD